MNPDRVLFFFFPALVLGWGCEQSQERTDKTGEDEELANIINWIYIWNNTYIRVNATQVGKLTHFYSCSLGRLYLPLGSHSGSGSRCMAPKTRSFRSG